MFIKPDKPAPENGVLNEDMPQQSLTERMEEVMQALKWGRHDVMRVGGVSSSVVSQWLGNGSKPIKTIGDVEVAIKLQQATGYNAVWLAKGKGPKMATSSQLAADALHVRQITEWARGLPADKLLKLHEYAHGLTFQDAAEGVPPQVSEARIRPNFSEDQAKAKKP